MEWLMLSLVLTVIACWVWSRVDKTPTRIERTPGECSCVWFKNDEGQYRALADVNCRLHKGE